MPHHFITLRTGLSSPVPGGLCLGEIDGQPFSYVDRVPYRGTEELDRFEVNRTLAGATEIVARQLFGDEYVMDMSRVTGINPRTLARDRTARFGMPLPALLLLAEAASHPYPRALGHALLAIAEIRDEMIRLEPSGKTSPADAAQRVFSDAYRLVYSLLEMRLKHRAPAMKDEGLD